MAQDRPAFRFVHTADLHLDSPLRSLALRDEALAERVAGASRRALRAIVDLCIEETVDALLIAGDLYDGDQTSMHTAAALTVQLRRLGDAGIPVYLIRGNHDAASRVTRELMLPDNVHEFSGRGDCHLLADGAIAIHGVSFRHAHAPESLLPKLKPPVPDALNVGLLHTSLTSGAGAHAVYAPCTLGELVDHGFDYWALGHVHKRAVHHRWPAVVMPGNPQGRDIGEDGPRSVSLVTLDADGAAIETREVNSTRFERTPVALGEVSDWNRLADAMEGALIDCRQSISNEQLIARLELSGPCAFARRLHRDADYLLDTAREIARGLDAVWIDKLVVDTASLEPAAPPDTPGMDAGALDELERLLGDETLASAEVLARLDAEATKMLRKLPPSARDLLGDETADHRERLLAVARTGGARLLASLRDGGPAGR